jgi:hypothetical protein
MDKYLFTGFDAECWNKYGTSWIASLKEFARFDGRVVVYMHDYSWTDVPEKLKLNAEVITNSGPGIGRDRTISLAEHFIAEHPGIHVHWDCDVYFQDSVDPVYEYPDSLVSSGTGMLGGSNEVWALFFDFYRLVQLVRPTSLVETVVKFNNHIPSMSRPLEDIWNFSDLSLLKWDNGYRYKDRIVPVVQNSQLDEYSFPNNYQSVYRKWRGTYLPKNLLHNHKTNIQAE